MPARPPVLSPEEMKAMDERQTAFLHAMTLSGILQSDVLEAAKRLGHPVHAATIARMKLGETRARRTTMAHLEKAFRVLAKSRIKKLMSALEVIGDADEIKKEILDAPQHFGSHR